MNGKWICSICALELYNEVKGTNYDKWPEGLLANAQLEICRDLRNGATLSNRPRRATRT